MKLNINVCLFPDLKLIREGSSIYKPCFSLDFQKIKHDLKNADLDIKLNLLQALRWVSV